MTLQEMTAAARERTAEAYAAGDAARRAEAAQHLRSIADSLDGADLMILTSAERLIAHVHQCVERRAEYYEIHASSADEVSALFTVFAVVDGVRHGAGVFGSMAEAASYISRVYTARGVSFEVSRVGAGTWRTSAFRVRS